MIYKSMSRHNPSYGSLLSYITRDGKRKDGKTPIFTHNLHEKSDLKKMEREFIQNEAFRRHPRGNQVYVFHEVLSFSKFENPEAITDAMLHDLARKFIELRASDSLAAYAIHSDTQHTHLHFAISGVKYRTGMANRMSKDAFHDVKVTLQQYQKDKYPELSLSLPEHGKGIEYLRDAEWHMKKRNERALTKETIRNTVTGLYNQSTTQKEFLELLRDNNLHHYERGGKVYGLMDTEGTKFRFTGLDIPFEKLPVDVIEKTEEERILEEIRAIREQREELYKELEQDREHFMDMDRFIHLNPNSLFE